MRCWVIVFILLLTVILPVRATDEAGWSWEPIEVKHSLSVTGTESTRLDWGADYDFQDGQLFFTGWGSWPGEDCQMNVNWNREAGVWDFGAWGIIKHDENYNSPSTGMDIRWENQGLSWGSSLTSLSRRPQEPGNEYGYGGKEVKADCGYRFENGCWLKFGVDQTTIDYPDNDSSSDKIDLNGSFRWKINKMRWLFSWKEWSYDYRDKPMNNSWGQQYGLDWTCPLESRQWTASMTASERQSGDGTTSRKQQVNMGETLFLRSSVWGWKCVATWQEGNSWIEDAYDLSDDSADDWGFNDSTSYGVTWSWQREFGPHRRWKLGGGLKQNETSELSWSCHSEWDWVLGEWRMRFYLNLTGNDNENKAGAWVKMTYYFS